MIYYAIADVIKKWSDFMDAFITKKTAVSVIAIAVIALGTVTSIAVIAQNQSQKEISMLSKQLMERDKLEYSFLFNRSCYLEYYQHFSSGRSGSTYPGFSNYEHKEDASINTIQGSLLCAKLEKECKTNTEMYCEWHNETFPDKCLCRRFF